MSDMFVLYHKLLKNFKTFIRLIANIYQAKLIILFHSKVLYVCPQKTSVHVQFFGTRTIALRGKLHPNPKPNPPTLTPTPIPTGELNFLRGQLSGHQFF